MSWLIFFSSVIGAVAWPAVVAFGLYLFRNRIGEIFRRPMSEIHFPGGGKVIFEKALAAGSEDAKRIEQQTPGAEAPALPVPTSPSTFPSPPAATLANVLLSYADVEQELSEARSLLNMKPIYGPEWVLNVLANRGLVPNGTTSLFANVRTARNLVAHAHVTDLSQMDLVEFERQVSIVLESIREAIRQLRIQKPTT